MLRNNRLWDQQEVTIWASVGHRQMVLRLQVKVEEEEEEELWKASPSRVYFWVLPECFCFCWEGKTCCSSAFCPSLISLFDSFGPTLPHVCLF